MNTRSWNLRLWCVAIFVAMLTIAGSAPGASLTWDYGATTGNWGDANNWSPNQVPVNGDSLVYNATLSNAGGWTQTHNLANDLQIAGVTFTGSIGGFTIGGNRVALTGNIAHSGSNATGAQTVNCDILLSGATRTFQAANTVAITAGSTCALNFGGAISGTVGLTLANTTANGKIRLFGTTANTYSGGTIVNHRGANEFCPVLLAKTAGVDAIPGDLQIGNSGTGYANVNLGASDQINDAGVITFAGASSKWSYFKLLGYNETVAGLVSVANGVIETMESETINTSSTLTLAGSGTYSYTGYMRNRSGGSGTGLLLLTKTGSGTQTIAGANITYTGATTVNAGLLKLTDATAFASSASVASGAELEFNSTSANDGTPDWGYAKTLAGAGTVNKTGTGWFHINTGTVSMSGQINVLAGIMSGNSAGSTWSGNTAGLDVSASAQFYTYNNVTVGALTGAGTVSHGPWSGQSSTLTVGANNGSGSFSGVLQNGSGTLSLTKTGTGTQTISGANTHTGATTVNQGELRLANQLAVQSSTLTMNGGTLVFDSSVGANAFTFGSLAASAAGAGYNIALINSAAAPTALTVGGNNSITTYAGVLSGGGSLTKTGTGTITLSGANTHSGVTTVNNGILIVANASALGTTDGNTIVGDGVGANQPFVEIANGVTVSGEPITLLSGTGAGGRGSLRGAASATATYTGDITLAGTQTDQLTANGTLLTVNGTIGGSCGTLFVRGSGTGTLNSSLNIGSTMLAKTDAGTWTISSSGNAWGNTQVSVGTLKLGVANAFPSATTLTMGQGDSSDATFDLNGFNQTLSGLALNSSGGTKTITSTAAATLTLNNATDRSYGGVFTGAGFSLLKTGAGKLTVSGASTHGGATTVNGGTLAYGVDNALGTGAVTVDGASTLLDVGAYSDSVGTVTLSGGAQITGTSGVLSSTSMFELQSGTVSASLGGTAGLHKTTADTVVLSGANTYTGATTVEGGALVVNGSLANANMTISAGSVSGSGTVTYRLDNDVSDLISVSGSGSINLAGLSLNLAVSGGQSATEYVLANDKTLVTGQFAATNAPAGWSVDYDGTTASPGSVVLVFDVSGATKTWDGGDLTAGTWAQTANWSGDTTPIAGAPLIFPAGQPWAENTNDLLSKVFSLTMAGGSTLRGNSLILGNNITNTGLNTIELPLVVANTRTINVAGGELTVSGGMSGAGGVAKAGAGTLTLSGVNTYLGETAVLNGTLRLVSDADPTATMVSRLSPLGYWPMSEGSGSSILNAVSGGPDGSLVSSPAWISGPGGAGTYGVAFNGSNYGEIVPDTALNTLGSGALTVSSWVKVGAGGVWYRSQVTKYGSTPFWGLGWSDASNLGFHLRNSGNSLTTLTTGTAAHDNTWHHLTGVREADGTMRVYLDGVLIATGSRTGDASSAANITIARHGTQNMTTSAAGVGVWNRALSADEVAYLYGCASVLPMDTALAVASGATVEVVGGCVTVGSLGDNSGAGGSLVLNGGALVVRDYAMAATYSGTISGTGSLNKSGTGTLTLAGSGANIYSGGTTIFGGVLALNKSAGVAAIGGNLSSGSLGATSELQWGADEQIPATAEIDFGTSGHMHFELLGHTQTVARITATSSVGVIENRQGQAGITNPGTFILNGSANSTFNGYMRDANSGTGGALNLVKNGTGTLTLSGGNLTHTGSTTVNQGELVLANKIGSSAFVTIGTGAKVTINWGNGSSYNNALASAAGNTWNVSGTLDSLTTAANTMPGTVILNNGTMSGTQNCYDPYGIYYCGNATVLTANGSGNTISLPGAYAIGLANTFTLNTPLAGDALAIAAVIGHKSGTDALVKNGLGTVTLSATGNGYTGVTTINAGTLLVTGTKTGAGAVAVNNGGTLAGAGTVAGVVTVNAGGSVAPGSSVGTLTLSTGLTMQPGSEYAFEFNNVPANDQIVVTTSGGLTINGGGFSLYDEGTTNSWMPAGLPVTRNLIQYTGAIGGTGVGALSVLNPRAGYTYTFGTSGGYVTLTVDASPEWTGNGGDDNWQTSGNWTLAAASGNALTFGTASPAKVSNYNDFSGATFNGITFAQDGTYTLTGNAISLGGSVVNLTANTQTINLAALTLTGARTFAATAGDLVIGAPIGGAFALAKTGPGSLTLNGVNTYSGVTTIDAGTLAIGGAGQLNSGTYAATITFLGSPSALAYNSSANQTFSGIISGPGSLYKSGASTLTLGVANSYTGGTVVSVGTLQLNNVGAAGSGPITIGDASTDADDAELVLNFTTANSNPITVSASGTGLARILDLNTTDNGGNNLTGVVTLNRPTTLQATGDNNHWRGLANITGNVGTLTILGGATTYGAHGRFVFSGANSFTGNVAIGTGGLVQLSHSGAIPSSSDLDVTGGWLQIGTAVSPTIGALSGTGRVGDLYPVNQALNLTLGANNHSGSFSGLLVNGGSAAMTLTKTGTGTQTLSGANTYTGTTTLNQGELRLANQLAVQSSTLTMNGGSLVFDSSVGANAFTLGGLAAPSFGAGYDIALVNSASTPIALTAGGNNGTTTYAGVLSGGGSFTKAGTGILTLSGNNTFTGSTTISGGTLSVGSLNSVTGGGLSSSLGAPLSVAAGTLKLGATTTAGALTYTGTGETTDRVIDLAGTTGGATITHSGTGLLKFTSAFTATGAGAKTLTLQGSTAGAGEIAGAIVDSSSATALTKAGTGTWTLSGNNTFTGTTTVNAGTLTVGGAGSISTLGVVTVSGASAVLNINGAAALGTGAGAGAISVNGGGILNIAGSVAHSVASGAIILGTAAGSGTMNITSGSFTENETGGNGVGIANGGAGTLNVTGGTLSVAGNDVFYVGMGSGGTGTMSISGTGSVVIGAGSAVFSVGQNAGSVGVLNLDGGTLTSGRNIVTTSGSGTFNFNGGTLKAGANLSVASSLTRANVRNNGAIIDDDGFTVTIDEPLLHSNIGGDNATDGGVTKLGGGSLTLTGANTYTGPTAVTAGVLTVLGSATLSGTTGLSVSDDAKFNYLPTTPSTLTLGAGSTLSLASGSTIGTTFGSSLAAAGAATVGAGAGIELSGSFTDGQTYTVLTAASGLNSGSFLLRNSTNYIGAITQTATAVSIVPFAATPLTAAYWRGGFPGYNNVWAASDGASQGNWVATLGGVSQPLVPGIGADVYISDSSVSTAPTATVLGGNMAVNTLTITDTVNGLGLNADGYALTIASGLTMNASVPASVMATPVILGGSQTWTVNSANGLTVSGAVSGAYDLTKAGTGALTLSGANTYSGTTTLGAGTLRLDGGNNRLPTGTTIAFTGTSTLDLGDTTQSVAGTTLASGNTYTVSGSGGALTTGGNLTSSASTFTVGAGATLNVPATVETAKNYDGTWNVNGTLTGGTFTGAYEGANYGDAVVTLNINSGGEATFTTMTISRLGWAGYTTATTTLNINSGGTLTATTIQGINNDSGAVNSHPAYRYINVAGGRLNVTTINLSQGGDGGNIARLTLNNGTVANIASGNLTVDIATAVRLQNDGTVEVSSGRTTTLNGYVYDTGNLVKAGAGTLTLTTTTNSFSGNITVNAGRLKGGTTANGTYFGSLSSSRTMTVNDGGTLDFCAANTFGGHTSGTVPTLVINSNGVVTCTGSPINNPLNNITLNGGTLTAAADNGATWRSWSINGTITSSGSSLISGGTAANPGLLLDCGGSSPFSTTVNVLDGTLTVSAPLLDGRDSASPFNEHATALTKSGDGTLTLSSASAYSGGTTISAGTMKLSNSTGSALGTGAVTVNSGGTLMGTGSAAGTVTVNLGGCVAPGASVGALTVGGLTMGAGGRYDFEFAAGTNDTIVVTGSDALTVSGGSFALYQENTTQPFAATGTYNLVQYSGTLGGSVGSLSVVNPQFGYRYTFGTAGGWVTLTIAEGSPVWTGGHASDARWTLADNWTVGAPLSGDILGFGTTGAARVLNTNDFGAGMILGGILFANDGTFTLTGNSINLRGSVVNNTANSQTLTLPLVLDGGNREFNTAAGNLAVSGNVSDGGSALRVIKTGAGTLTLSGANTFTGGVTLERGSLELGSAGAVGSSGSITFEGGTLRSSAANTTDYSARFSTAASQAYSLDTAGQSVTLATALTSSGGSLAKLGAGTLTLSAANTFTGGLTINGGVVRAGNNAQLPQNNVATIAASGAFDWNGFGNSSTRGYTFYIAGSGPDGLGAMRNSTATSVAGNASVSNLVLTANATVAASGRWDIGTSAANMVLNGGGFVLTKIGTAEMDIRVGTITNLAGLVVQQGDLYYENYNQTGDATRYSTNTVQSGARLGSYGTVTFNMPVVLNGGTLYQRTSSTGPSTWTGGFLLNSNSFVDTTGQNIAIAGAIAGSASLTKTGAATLTLTGANTFAGGITNSAGTLIVGSAGDGSGNHLGYGPLTMAGGTLVYTGAVASATSRSVTQSAAATYNITSPTGVLALNGAIGGPGALSKGGSGTLTLGSANTYAGATTISAGTLAATADSALSAAALTIGSGTVVGSLDLSGSSQSVASLTVGPNTATANTITIGSGRTLTVNGNVTVGNNTAAGTATTLNVLGGGSFVVNSSGGTIQIGAATGGSNYDTALLNMSGLGSFTANLGSGGTLRVGDLSTASVSPSPSVLTLATNSTITAGSLLVGEANGHGSVQYTLRLGAGVNTINANTISISHTGTGRCSGRMLFDTAAGSLVVRGAAGGSSRATLNVGNHTSTTGTAISSLVDLLGHDADLRLGTVTVASRVANSALTDTGTLSFNQGTLDITTLVLGKRGSTSGTSVGTLNIGGGAATIGSATLAESTTAGGTANGTINLTGGSLTMTGNLNKGTSTGAGTATLNLGAGTLRAGADFTVASGVGITLTGNGTMDSQDYTITVPGAIGGAGFGFTKQGVGTLTLSGTSTYTGATLLSAGTLNLTGALGATAVSVASGAELRGEGSIGGSLSLLDGANLRIDPTTEPGALTVGDLNLSGVTTVILDPAPAPGDGAVTNRVLNYTGSLSGGPANFALSTTGYRTPTFTTGGGQVNVSYGSYNLTWTGAASGTWNINGAANWTPELQYFDGDSVTFADGPSFRDVTLDVEVLPSGVTFSNTGVNNYTLTGSGRIAGASRLTMTGSGAITLSTDNSFSGGSILGSGTANSGVVILGHTNALGGGTVTLRGAQLQAAAAGLSIPNDVTVESGGFRFGGGQDLAFSGPVTLSGGDRGIGNYSGSRMLTLGPIDNGGNILYFEGTDAAAANGTIRVNGVISGTGQLYLQNNYDNGTVILAGANTYGGITTLAAGTLRLDGGNNRLPTGTTVAFAGTSTLDVGSNTQSVAGMTIAASISPTIDGSGGTLTAGGTVTINTGDTIGIGSGATLSVPGTISHAGGATATWNVDGTLTAGTFTGCYSSGNFSSDTVTLNLNAGSSATFTTMSIGRIAWAQDTTATTTINIGNGATLTATTIQGQANDSGAVGYKRPHKYLNVNSGGRLVATTITLSAGGDSSTVRRMTLSNGTLANIASGNLTADTTTDVRLQNDGTVEVSSGRTATLNGYVYDTGNLVKEGAGTLTLTATTNSFSGNITVNAGRLKGGATASATYFGSLSSSRTMAVNAGGTLDFTAAGIFGAHDSITVPTLVINSNGVTTCTGTSINNPLNNVTLSDGTLTAAADNGATWRSWSINGTITSSGSSLISGGTAANPGVLLDCAGTTPWSTTVNVLDGTLTVSAPVLNGRDSASPYNEHTTALTKSGDGTLTFSNANTYSGGTTISAGTVKLSNSSGSALGTGAVTVNSGGTLTGTGSAAGAVTVNSGGCVAPGAGVGALTLGGLTMGAGSRYDFEFSAGANDSIVVTGSGALTVSGGSFALYQENTTQPFAATGTYNLVQYSGALGGSVAGLSVLNPQFGYRYIFGTSGGWVTLTISDGSPVWTGGHASDAKWTLASNWTAGGLLAGDIAAFGSAGAARVLNTNDFSAGLNLTGILFANDGTFTLTGNSINLQGNVVNNTPNVQTLALPMVLTGADRYFNAAAGNLAVSGIVSDGGSALRVMKTGAGTLTLSGANTFTGGVALNDGSLELGSAGAIGSSGSITFGGGTLRFSAANTTDYSARFSTGASQAYSLDTAGRSVTLATALTSSGGSLTKLGAGSLTLTGVNTYNSGTTIGAGAGTLFATVSTTQNSLGTGAAAVGAGSTLQLNNGNTSGTSVTLGNTFTGSGTLVLRFASGTTARNTYMAGVTDFAGTIRLSNAGSNGDKWTAAGVNAPGASVVVDSGSQLFVATAAATFAGVDLTGTGNSETRGGLRLAQTLNAPVRLMGNTTIGSEGGTINGDITSGAAGTQTLTIGTASSTGNATFNGSIGGGTGTIALTKTQSGTLTLGGSTANTYAGATIASGTGVLQLNKSDNVVAIPGNLEVQGAASPYSRLYALAHNQFGGANSVLSFTTANYAIFELLGTTQTVAGITCTSTYGIIQNRQFGSGSGGVGTLVLCGTGNYSYSGGIRDNYNSSGTMALIKTGTGTQTFSGTAITNTGPTTVNGGRLKLVGGSANDFCAASSLVLGSSGTLEVNQASGDYRLLNKTVSVTGTGTFQKTGAGGTYMANNGSNYQVWFNMTGGAVDVQAGTLRSFSTQPGNRSTLNVASGATASMNTAGLSASVCYFDALTGDGTVRLDGAATRGLVVGANGGSGSFAGTIGNTGTLSLTKTGAGQQTLSGPNTYTGGTIVNNGTLRVSGALGTGNVTVAGGTLALEASTAIADGATLSVAAGATVNVADGVAETVGELYLNGKRMWPGTWGSNTSPAPNKSPYFTGTGVVVVTSGAPHPATMILFK